MSDVVYVIGVGEYDDTGVDSIWRTLDEAKARFDQIATERPAFCNPVTIEQWQLGVPDFDPDVVREFNWHEAV